MPPSKIFPACHRVLQRAATWKWSLPCLVKDPTLKSAHRSWLPPLCRAEVVLLKETGYYWYYLCWGIWESWQYPYGIKIIYTHVEHSLVSQIVVSCITSGVKCLFTVFQNIVPLATLWNRNLRIIMICPSTATFPGIMICPQCEGLPPHRHGDCPIDLLENYLKTLVLL